MELNKEKENVYLKLVKYMMVNGKMILYKVMVYLYLQMIHIIKDNGKTIKNMDKVKKYFWMDQSI